MADIPTSDDMKNAIAQSVEDGIATVATDGLSTSEHSLQNRLEALKELQKMEAAKCGVLPIRKSKVISRGL